MAAEGSRRTAERIHGWVGDPNAKFAHLAIVFTDVVGSTQLLHNIKLAAWAKVRNQHLDHADALVKQYGGYLVKSMGDGCLIAFRNSIDALKFAVEIERQPGHDKISVRVGIHVGQVQVDKGDVHGQVVNLASRVMDIAKQGGVLVSSQVKADFDSAFSDDHHPYSWVENPDREIPDFPGEGSVWSVRFRTEGGSLPGEDF